MARKLRAGGAADKDPVGEGMLVDEEGTGPIAGAMGGGGGGAITSSPSFLSVSTHRLRFSSHTIWGSRESNDDGDSARQSKQSNYPRVLVVGQFHRNRVIWFRVLLPAEKATEPSARTGRSRFVLVILVFGGFAAFLLATSCSWCVAGRRRLTCCVRITAAAIFVVASCRLFTNSTLYKSMASLKRT